MPIPGVRFTVRWLMVAVAGLALLLGFVVNLNEQQKLREDYSRERGRFIRLFHLLYGKAPQGVSQSARGEAFQLVYQAGYLSELPYSRRGVEDVARVCDEFERKLRGDTGPETLRWLWDRLARRGEAGKRYSESRSDEFQRAVEKWTGTGRQL
jgi:hypothetical protein